MNPTREQILNRKLPSENVPCPELGPDATLIVRRMTAREYLEFLEQSKASPDLTYAHWIVATVVNESGAKVFNLDDAKALADTDALLVNRLAEVAMKLNIRSNPGKN